MIGIFTTFQLKIIHFLETELLIKQNLVELFGILVLFTQIVTKQAVFTWIMSLIILKIGSANKNISLFQPKLIR